ncbi:MULTISPECIES: phage major capsid protein [Xanthomonas]|uniref:Phage major capsid protein n=1 Tax=Xanthomonas dyei TaxID=743699 RepID=A0ABZ0D8X9_9XANT|nr:phage major capsid protein [Xanthomonas dyei]WOB24753.1 phage major capsid protein [Xanthomonas dyei]WOB52381.1 phage major capsid protein [Xanthomonas dyei]
MPLTTAQLLAGANRQMMTYSTDDPIDQFSTDRPFASWLISNRADSVFGNGIYNEKVRISNDSNYQNYTGDDQVTYNRKDTVRLAPFQHYEAHDGFTLNETELANNGIILTDDRNAVMTDAEKIQIVNLLDENWSALKDGFQENWDIEVHLDGSTNPKAVPGLDALVSTTPNIGVLGGIDAATSPYWRNFADMAIPTGTAGVLITRLETLWRQTVTYGKMGAPNFIPVGAAMYDAIQADALKVMSRQITMGTNSTGGITLDPSTKALAFKGVPVVWDPSFEAIDARLGPITYPWTKRGYFLNSKTIKLRPVKGRWMVKRTPPRVYDRYTHYFGQTADYGLTTKKRNSNAVFSIA